ncbi:NAD/FAD-dependent oxidoreductase [Marinicauda salina]|uniref:NAD/FAD-dependent oxidoreductase n=1 Tax=Marinicauda salina TaxID=2135793 RepID=A0A2U2BY10_9PROT|nr:NAD(P)-binding protein [Marinicauda salina]PWE18869.1 NAD/FAD-dependent oxidoreductase [Marinicauda salina]
MIGERRDAAVIGAGLAGAACAGALSEAGFRPVVFDKARGPGGRMATRRAETPLGAVRIDHGAQYVTAEGDAFASLLAEAEAAGSAARWDARLVSIGEGGAVEPASARRRWVGTPGMNAVVKTALDGLEVAFGRRAACVSGGPGDWRVRFDDGREEGPFARLALTQPPAQLIDFLARSDGDFADLIAKADAAALAPCQAVMVVLDAPFDPGFDAARLEGGGLSWAARTNAKPGRTGPQSWVLHASPDWSRAHLETAPDAVVRLLVDAARARFGLPQPVWAQAHRWLYARVETPADSPAGLDASRTLGCAGDWRIGPRAEAAWESGLALGRALAG